MVRCARCGRLLEDPKSIGRGYGPKCWTKLELERLKEQALHNGGLDTFVKVEGA